MDRKEDPPGEHRWPSRWAKTLLAAGLTLAAVVVGLWLKPSKPLARDIVQPTITIFASQPDVSAVVAMSAKANRPAVTATASAATTCSTTTPPGPGYELDIALKVLTPRTSVVRFVLLLGDFPRIFSTMVSGLTASAAGQPATALSEVLPVPGQDAQGYADYLAFGKFVPPLTAAARAKRPSEPTVRIMTQYSVVSRSSGSELQVAFPIVLDEKVASSPLPPAQSFPITTLLGAYHLPTDLSGEGGLYYEPSLEPGDIEYRPGSGTNLADYQTLAGTGPVIRPAGAWSWAGLSDVSLLAQDVLTADIDQEHLFWDGVAWGVVGAAGIAFVLELVSAIQEEKKKTRVRKRRQSPANRVRMPRWYRPARAVNQADTRATSPALRRTRV